MKTVIPLLLLMILTTAPGILNKNNEAGIAKYPPMGWNSFDSYGVYLHEDAAMKNLEAMACQPGTLQ